MAREWLDLGGLRHPRAHFTQQITQESANVRCFYCTTILA